MSGVFDILKERGFIEQMTHEEEIKQKLNNEKVTFYIGFDATADSLTAGHFLTVMAMMHMQKAGHRPIALLGGGTTMIGDPTGRTDMRQIMTPERIQYNAECFEKQLSRFIDFSDEKAFIVNNADWLLDINYVDFLRNVGVHFSVNRMLAADAYKSRLEQGLTFFEFNYMLMQSYDFYRLFKEHNCTLQLGGNDQWSNIISGVDLIRRKERANAFGMTFTLLTTSDGTKMGKTQAGAIWLDPNKTTPYEFYQYWRNVEDNNVEKCLGLLTFLPMDEVRRLGALEGAQINQAKEVLAYELTTIVHGEDEAKKAHIASQALFVGGAAAGSIPTTTMIANDFQEGIDIITLLQKISLISSRSEGRRLIEQGGLKLNAQAITEIATKVTIGDFNEENSCLIQKGKKIFHRIQLS